jgi:hypothetical protein
VDEPPYQSRYCEENIWLLLHRRRDECEQAWAVIISNANKTCALWHQRAAPASEQPVVWDYHVIALESVRESYRIWDLDSELDVPVASADWWAATFPFEERVPDTLRPSFRVVERDVFLETFSSDRSHMRDSNGDWLAPPPEWDPIFEPAAGMRLPAFTDMSRRTDVPGRVFGYSEFRDRFVDTSE